MNHPDDDVLAAIALGDPEPADAADHVRTCPACTEAVAALHATLATLRAPVPQLVAPPPAVWDAVVADLDAPSGTVWAAAPDEAPAPAVDDELARHRAARADAAPPARRRRIPLAWVAGAAAAGLVVGVAGTRLLESGDPAPAAVTVASTSLDTLDTQQVKGSAEVVRHDDLFDLAVSTEPIDPEDGYLEVWLINKDLERMVSVGVLQPGVTDQSFAIPQDLLEQGYVIVDISREGFDDAPEHSGDSIVRGTLPT